MRKLVLVSLAALTFAACKTDDSLGKREPPAVSPRNAPIMLPGGNRPNGGGLPDIPLVLRKPTEDPDLVCVVCINGTLDNCSRLQRINCAEARKDGIIPQHEYAIEGK